MGLVEKEAYTLTLMIISSVEVLRTTLQKRVPVGLGRVLGRYSSPRFKLKSFWT